MPDDTNSEQLWNVQQVADYLQCSKRQVNRMSADRLIPPPVYIGRLRRWRQESIMEWIRQECPLWDDME